MTEENLINDPLVKKEVRNLYVMTGGGARGAWQFKVLEELVAAGYPPYSMSGASTGTFGCFLYVNGLEKEGWDMYRKVFSTDAAPIFSPVVGKIKDGKLKIDWFKLATKALFQPKKLVSILDNAPLIQTLTDMLKLSKVTRCPFFFNVASLQSTKLLQFNWGDFDSDDQRILAMASSAAIPVICPPTKSLRGVSELYKILVDGGTLEGAPLSLMFKQREQEYDYRIFVLSCNKTKDEEDDSIDTIWDVLGRSVSMTFTKSLNENLARTMDRNETAKEYGEKIGQKYTPIHIIEYSGNRGVFEFTPESLEDQIQTAIKDAKTYLDSANAEIS